jgi:Pectate lyase superfamily protein
MVGTPAASNVAYIASAVIGIYGTLVFGISPANGFDQFGNAYLGNLPGYGSGGYVNARSFGADPTGTADSGPAINNALADAANLGTGGAGVYLPPGTYLFETPIVPQSGTRLLADNRAGTQLVTTTCNMFAMGPATTIKSFELDHLFCPRPDSTSSTARTSSGPTSTTTSISRTPRGLGKDRRVRRHRLDAHPPVQGSPRHPARRPDRAVHQRPRSRQPRGKPKITLWTVALAGIAAYLGYAGFRQLTVRLPSCGLVGCPREWCR